VDPSSKNICVQDVTAGDEDSNAGYAGEGYFLARENTNSMGTHRLPQNGPMPAYNGYAYPMANSMPTNTPIVLPAIHVRNEPMPDAHLYGRPFEQNKAQQVQQTISGLLGQMQGYESYPSYQPPPLAQTYTPLPSYMPPPLEQSSWMPSFVQAAQTPVIPPTRSRTPSPGPQSSRSSARFCSECGAPFLDTAKFCSGCGSKRRKQSKTGTPRESPEEMDEMLSRRGITLGRGVWA